MEITSSDNKTYKKLKLLLDSKGIKKHGEFLLFGESVIREFEQKFPERVIAKLWAAPTHSPETKNSYFLKPELFKELDIFGTKKPILWVKSQPIKKWSKQDAVEDTEIFIATGDPSNLGALLRSVAAFDWKKVILLKECANPFHPKATRASSGLSTHLELFHGPSIHELDDLQHLCALDLTGDNLYQKSYKAPIRLLIGEEGPGIPKNLEVDKINIPISHQVESLNATIAASIAMSYISNKLN